MVLELTEVSGNHHLRFYYQTLLPIRLIFIHAYLLPIGPQPSSLPNLYVRLNIPIYPFQRIFRKDIPKSNDIQEGPKAVNERAHSSEPTHKIFLRENV